MLVIVTGIVFATPAGRRLLALSGSVGAASPAGANETVPVNGSATSVPGVGEMKVTTSVQVPGSGLSTVASSGGRWSRCRPG